MPGTDEASVTVPAKNDNVGINDVDDVGKAAGKAGCMALQCCGACGVTGTGPAGNFLSFHCLAVMRR